MCNIDDDTRMDLDNDYYNDDGEYADGKLTFVAVSVIYNIMQIHKK